MITIRKEQIASIKQNEDESVAKQAYDHINKFIPEELTKISEVDFIETAKQQINIAKKHGIKDTSGYLRYILISFIFGEKFHTEYKLFNDILTQWDLRNNEKGEVLMKAAIEIFNTIEEP